MRVCLVAAENDALPGAKVGGIGDVLRDLPRALAEAGVEVTVVLPSYGALHRRPDAERIGSLPVRFGQGEHRVEAWSLADPGAPSVRLVVLHDEAFAICGTGRIYCDDPSDAPFARDAGKFALFGAAVLALLDGDLLPPQDVLHLHDWHAAFVAVLREFDPRYRELSTRRMVFSIHNLALQGVRPFEGHRSSLVNWFPWLDLDADALAALADPRWDDCINPMAAGIRLADKVHAVSPTYAEEIVAPNDPARGFHGGEGLEQDLRDARAHGRLVGILNGAVYDRIEPGADDGIAWRRSMRVVADRLLIGIARGETVRAVDYLAHQRALDWSAAHRAPHLLTFVGRLVEQKARLLLEPLADGRPALAHLLERHAERAVLILLGSGDAAIEREVQSLAATTPNLLFLNRYDAEIARLLYRDGDLFLMPSSFEPCGISQMLAMRDGQPCLVHAVGGLVDTVQDGEDGFRFSGSTRREQAEAMLARLSDALSIRERDPDRWAEVRTLAASRRFGWDDTARRTITELYR